LWSACSCLLSPNSNSCVMSQHDTTCYAHAFWQGKVLMSRLSDSTARHARQSSRRARQARLARHVLRDVATDWTGVDVSTSLFPEVVAEIDANPEHKRLSLYTRALLLLRRPSCWNKHGATRTTRMTRHVTTRTTLRACCVVTCRDVT